MKKNSFRYSYLRAVNNASNFLFYSFIRIYQALNKPCNAINKIKILADNTHFFHVMAKL